MTASGDDLTAVRIREQAHIVWHSVSKKDKEAWGDLHDERFSDPKVYKKGRRLLETQGLLARLKANCRRIVHGTSPGSSRPAAPTLPEPVEASTAPSGDTNSLQHASDQPPRPPVPTSSEKISAVHPRREKFASTRNSPSQSPSPPSELIPSQHTSEAYTRPKSDASTQSTPDQYSSGEEEEEEEEPTPLKTGSVSGPRFKDEASVHRTPGRSPFPPEPTVPDHTPSIHPTRMSNLKTEGNFSTPFPLSFCADHPRR
jgi:hypothetical protein